jgi:hypothetical protein
VIGNEVSRLSTVFSGGNGPLTDEVLERNRRRTRGAGRVHPDIDGRSFGVTFSQLSEDIGLHIVKRLAPESLHRTGQINRHFRQLARSHIEKIQEVK